MSTVRQTTGIKNTPIKLVNAFVCEQQTSSLQSMPSQSMPRQSIAWSANGHEGVVELSKTQQSSGARFIQWLTDNRNTAKGQAWRRVAALACAALLAMAAVTILLSWGLAMVTPLLIVGSVFAVVTIQMSLWDIQAENQAHKAYTGQAMPGFKRAIRVRRGLQLLALLPLIFFSLAGMGIVALEMAASSAITTGSFRLTLGAGVGPMLYGKLHDKSERVMEEYWAKQPPQRKQALY